MPRRHLKPSVRTTAYDVASPQTFEGISSGWHQLLFPTRAALQVTIGDSRWVVPAGQGLWIPGGVRHRIEVAGPVGVRSVFFRTKLARLPGRPPRRVRIGPLLREVLRRTLELGTLDPAVGEHRRLLEVLVDELVTIRRPVISLRMPRDPRAARAAEAVLGDLAGSTTPAAIARRAATSARTLSRLFRAETGLGFGAWRQRARLVRSVQLLVEGQPVARVAVAVGYQSVSAYIAAFAQAFGVTPGRYLDPE